MGDKFTILLGDSLIRRLTVLSYLFSKHVAGASGGLMVKAFTM